MRRRLKLLMEGYRGIHFTDKLADHEIKFFNGNQQQRKSLIFKIFCLILFFSTVPVFLFEYHTAYNHFNNVKQSEVNILLLQEKIINKDMVLVMEDLSYLKHEFEMTHRSIADMNELSQKWLRFLRDKPIYDELVYIDKEGNEIIKIDNHVEAKVVPKADLKVVKESTYFRKTLEIDHPQIYLSNIIWQLNQEGEGIPLLRICTPVKTNGNDNGMMVLSYDLRALFEAFNDFSEYASGDLFLMTSEGKVLHKDRRLILANKEAPQYSLSSIGIDEAYWDPIKKGQQFLTASGLVTSNVLQSQNVLEGHDIIAPDHWIMVSLIPRNNQKGILFVDHLGGFNKAFIFNNAFLLIFLMGMSVAFAVMYYMIRGNYYKFKFYSNYDTLTSCFNRRAGLEILCRRFESNHQKLTRAVLCFIDINGLKEVNDHLGHEYGDELITTVSELVQRQIRPDDYMMRMGGDEFLIVYQETSIEESEMIWKRVLNDFTQINLSDSRPYNISVSHGCVEVNESNYKHLSEAIKLADFKMYEEKSKIKEAAFNVLK